VFIATIEPKLWRDCRLVIKENRRRPGLLDTLARPLTNVCGREWTASSDTRFDDESLSLFIELANAENLRSKTESDQLLC
jgi:hypothetical protein